MATLLYVASTETFAGKSAVCMGLLNRMRRDGLNITYMKPVSVSDTHTPNESYDEDAMLLRETMGIDTPIHDMSPVLITPRVIDAILGGQTLSFADKISDGCRSVSQNRDVVLLEGTNSWAEGALVDLAADQVVSMLDAPVLLVTRYDTIRTVDTILTVQRYFSNHIIGVLINQIEHPYMEFVQRRVVPYLESKGILVFGLLPHERFLASVTVGELLTQLNGNFIGNPEWRDNMVESLMVGAMGTEASLSFFRRRANKAVITGGDRLDLQLVALETSTNVLILTGNIRPSQSVLYRAEEREVPIIVVPDDTLTTVEKAEKLFGRIRSRQHAKLQHFIEMMDERFDYQRLYDTIGIRKKS
jgi:BioD-like phosphotransacetylase family protein